MLESLPLQSPPLNSDANARLGVVNHTWEIYFFFG
jgi:hypothetical protein